MHHFFSKPTWTVFGMTFLLLGGCADEAITSQYPSVYSIPQPAPDLVPQEGVDMTADLKKLRQDMDAQRNAIIQEQTREGMGQRPSAGSSGKSSPVPHKAK